MSGINSQDIDDNVTIQDGGGSGKKAAVVTESGLDRLAVTLPSDPATGGTITIGMSHIQVHKGKMFSHTDQATLGVEAVHELVMTTAVDSWVHLITILGSESWSKYELFENPTLVEGAAVNVFNQHRDSAITPDATLKEVTSITSDGTLIYEEHIEKYTNPVSSNREEGHEWVLKDNEQYLIRFTSEVGGNDLSWKIHWYEEDEKGGEG